MPENHKFISLEDEILLRRALHMTYKHEGMAGIYACMGELNRSLQITSEVGLELLAEEEKKRSKGDNL